LGGVRGLYMLEPWSRSAKGRHLAGSAAEPPLNRGPGGGRARLVGRLLPPGRAAAVDLHQGPMDFQPSHAEDPRRFVRGRAQG